MFPHLNLEELSQPIPLILFISARSRTHPKAWTAHDSRMLAFGYELYKVRRMYLHGYKMHFNEDIDQVYATLEAGDPERKSQHASHNFDMMPDAGVVALVVQKHTLNFLVKVCQLILHDIGDLAFDGPFIPVRKLPESSSHHVIHHTTGEHVSLSTIAAEAPYRGPSTGNLGTLLVVAQAQIEAAKDHLLGLRQDPGYYREFMVEASVHHGGWKIGGTRILPLRSVSPCPKQMQFLNIASTSISINF